MKIDKIHIENFTVFENIEIKFNSGINIFIGKNGTGKTHLLKLLYGIKPVKLGRFLKTELSMSFFRTDVQNLIRDEDYVTGFSFSGLDNQRSMWDIISSVQVNFKNFPLDNLEYTINSYQGMYNDSEEIDYEEEEIDYEEEEIDYEEEVSYNGKFPDYNPNYTFIPAKEILSHSKGFLALNNRFDLPFDETYIDIITSSELPEAKTISESSTKIINRISKIIGGEVVNENGSFYINKKSRKIEFSMEAEGLRKFGLLWKLIKNGLIEKDSILIWDEPEANINPELLPTLAKILLILEKEGVQIFIATHSYNFAKYLELFRENNSSVEFYNLYKIDGKVHIDANEYFGNLKNNSIIDSDFDLYEEVIESIEDDSWKNL